MHEKLPPDMQGTAKTPALSDQFNTKSESKKLSEEQGQLIHHVVKKPRYLSRCTKQDIQTVVGFLCIE